MLVQNKMIYWTFAFSFIFILITLLFCINRGSKIRLGNSPVHGKGVFSEGYFTPGDIIETVPLIFFDREELGDTSILREYDISFNDKNAIMLGYGSIYNHSDDNNALWEFDNENLIIKCVKPIYRGDEIFVTYGEKYWETRNNKLRNTNANK